MKLFSFLCCILFLFADIASAIDIPDSVGSVNDFAGMIDASSEASIVQLIDGIKQKTSIEIAVLSVESLDGVPKEDFAISVAEKWGIGNKETNNGILILLAKQEREYRVEIGRGLEGVLNDAKVGRIARQVMVPNFKREQFGRGVFELILEFKGFIEHDPEVVARYEQNNFDVNSVKFSFFEFLFDTFVAKRVAMPLAQLGMQDTMMDLFMDWMGALAAGVLFLFNFSWNKDRSR